MPEFMAQVATAAGGVQQVQVQAADAGAVAQALGVPAGQLLAVQAVQTVQTAASGQPGASSFWSGRPPRLDLRLFSQDLAVLLDAGIPLLEAIETLREQAADAGGGNAANTGSPSHRRVDAVLGPVLQALREGQPLSAALGLAPTVFDSLFIALVAASEQHGQLAGALRDHAAYLAWTRSLRQRLQAALVYPALLLLAGGAVVVFLLLFVLPRFAGVFEGLHADLPAASQALLALGVVAAQHPLGSVLLALLLPVLALLAWRWPAARAAAVRLAWRSPGVGQRLRVVALARLYRSLGVLVGAGVPVPLALQLATPVLAAPLRSAAASALDAVSSGWRLSQALQQAGLATPVAWRMVRVGESSGTLAPMLARAAAFHDEEIARLADWVTRVANPVLMLVMGVVIGGIVVLMYLPIFTLMEQVG